MAIPDGKPATDFSAMNREWVRAVAKEEAAGEVGIPAPENPSNGDVLTFDSTSSAWVAEAPSGGSSFITIGDSADTLDKTWSEIRTAFISGSPCFVGYTHPVTEELMMVLPIIQVSGEEGVDYTVTVIDTAAETFTGNYVTDSASGYPVLE